MSGISRAFFAGATVGSYIECAEVKVENQQGFSLIELMIVVAIIGVLSAIVLPSYTAYSVRAANNACLSEAKSIANNVLVARADNDPSMVQASVSACQSASGIVSGAFPVANFTFQPKTPGDSTIICDVTNAHCSY